MTLPDELVFQIGAGIATIGISWGIVKARLAGYREILDKHDALQTSLSNRILTLEQTVADRVARIETKLDLLLSAYLRALEKPKDKDE